jgi:hypothetical protein
LEVGSKKNAQLLKRGIERKKQKTKITPLSVDIKCYGPKGNVMDNRRIVKISRLILFTSVMLPFYGMMCDPGYKYNFYIDNRSKSDLTAKFKISENYHSPEGAFSDSVFIPKLSKKLILNDEGLGGAFELGDRFNRYIDSIYVYRNDTCLYRQCPTVDSLWKTDSKTGNAGAGWRNYSLELFDSMLSIQ